MDIVEATIRTRGEVTFTSREVGRLADTEPYVLNTALYYALGLAQGQYVDRTFEPSYVDDTESIADEVYVSPAAPVPGTTPEFVTTTYNTTRDEYAVVNHSAEDDPYEGRNLPSYGRRRSLAQGTDLRFYIIPKRNDASSLVDKLPQYTRIGKKRGKTRIDLTVREAERGTGTFGLDHPIGAYDHEATPTANVITKSMQPTPLILQADYEGEYLQIDRDEAGTDPETVQLPTGLMFLTTKR